MEALMSETEMRALAAELENLKRVLEEQAAELRDAREAAERNAGMAQLGQLVSNTAHELRSPLGAMLTSLHVVEGRLQDADPATIKGLDRIRRSIKRCDEIISKLLEFSRQEPLSVEDTGIDQWLQALFHSQTLPESVSLSFEQGLSGARYAIDRDQMAQAIAHIVNNAAEAITESGPPGRITVSTRGDEAMLEITIADTGPGIPEDQLAMVFDPFFSGRHTGLGLGLPIARRIVERHGGRIDVERLPGGGTAVKITLPAEIPPSAS
jgi:two-component system sensor histidine kinase HydH